ncbi:hypothetical protein [Actinopolymorpha pittospori]|uniref:AAA domain-containing protein n=1 Tax=Actinopolymorpha pittospori TaxID=648752 RepID=A0A927RPW7_9ACTN|nr:hypothetical protein [Actinopolymorpha pittospori]MBE1612541.1 hypothetical protein [Actinopolymorpha pittospori]
MPPTLLLLTGPAGSGKSTAAAAWAARGGSPRAAIDVDAIRLLIRAGVARPEHGWTAETERQWNLGTKLAMAMAGVYLADGVDCVVDVYAPPGPGDPWEKARAELPIQRVVLLPSFAVCVDRNRTRNRQPFLEEERLRGNYDDFEWCVRRSRPAHVIDNGVLTVEETVDAVEAELALMS